MARDSKTTSSDGDEPFGMEDVSVKAAPAKRVWGSDPADDAVVDEDGTKKKREKLTGAELEARWEAGAGARSAAFKKATTPGRLRAGLAAALVIGSLVGGVLINANASSFERARLANIATIDEIQGKIDAIGKDVSAQPDGEKLKKYVEDAQRVGGSIASTQNEYLKLGSGPEDLAKVKGVAKAMDAYLADTRVRNARVPWGTKPSGPNAQTDPVGWRFVSATPVAKGKPNEIEMLWVMSTSKSGELVSWAMGIYDGASGKITKMTWGLTKKGVSLIPNSDSNDAPPSDGHDHDHEDEGATPAPSASASPTPSASTSAGTPTAAGQSSAVPATTHPSPHPDNQFPTATPSATRNG